MMENSGVVELKAAGRQPETRTLDASLIDAVEVLAAIHARAGRTDDCVRLSVAQTRQLLAAARRGLSAGADLPAAPETLDGIPAALRSIGWETIAHEWELMQEVLALYANDEDRASKGDGEPFGTIPTEAGMKARTHRAAFRRRETEQA